MRSPSRAASAIYRSIWLSSGSISAAAQDCSQPIRYDRQPPVATVSNFIAPLRLSVPRTREPLGDILPDARPEHANSWRTRSPLPTPAVSRNIRWRRTENARWETAVESMHFPALTPGRGKPGAAMPISQWDIRIDDLSSLTTRDLVRLHLEGMHAHSPPGSVFALEFTGLIAPEVTVWTVWSDGKIAGMGALKDLGDRAGELKSMRTHPDFLRRGVASALAQHLIRVTLARRRARLSLETGSGLYFQPALSLYPPPALLDRQAFADYRRSAFNQFLHLAL